jgi:hypothetical protein
VVEAAAIILLSVLIYQSMGYHVITSKSDTTHAWELIKTGNQFKNGDINNAHPQINI